MTIDTGPHPAVLPLVWFLPSEPASAGAVRRRLDPLLSFMPMPQRDDVLLAASELVTNAVVHGEGTVTVWVRPCGQGLRVEVTDDGGGRPELPYGISEDDEGGRGLFIVDVIATRWGVAPTNPDPGSGTTVWFEINPAPTETPHQGGQTG